MAAISTTYPHLHLDSSGRAWVDGANVKVIEVAADFFAPLVCTGESMGSVPGMFPFAPRLTSIASMGSVPTNKHCVEVEGISAHYKVTHKLLSHQ